eukprot:3001809-Pyramimonas_sp.AAC.1
MWKSRGLQRSLAGGGARRRSIGRGGGGSLDKEHVLDSRLRPARWPRARARRRRSCAARQAGSS